MCYGSNVVKGRVIPSSSTCASTKDLCLTGLENSLTLRLSVGDSIVPGPHVVVILMLCHLTSVRLLINPCLFSPYFSCQPQIPSRLIPRVECMDLLPHCTFPMRGLRGTCSFFRNTSSFFPAIEKCCFYGGCLGELD